MIAQWYAIVKLYLETLNQDEISKASELVVITNASFQWQRKALKAFLEAYQRNTYV